MNNAEIIRGIEMTIEGLTAIKSALAVEAPKAVDTTAKNTKESIETAMNAAPVEEKKEDSAQQTTSVDVEALKKMKYNEFKKYASSLGVKCTGTRDEIMKRILDLGNVADTAEEVVEEPKKQEEVAEEKSDSVSGSKKKLAKKVEEPARDEFDEQAEEIAKDTDVEDILEALADVDVKATKKNYLEKLAYALREGLLQTDDEDEDSEEEADEEVADETSEDEEVEYTEESDDEEDDSEESDDDEDGVEIEADSYFPQFDPDGVNDVENMTDERKEAILAKMDKILTDVSEDKLTISDIETYIENNATQDEIDLLGDEYSEDEELMLYMELVKRTIDNDGEEHEPADPYECGEEDFCCGHKLKLMKETGNYYCEHCGTEYEAE